MYSLSRKIKCQYSDPFMFVSMDNIESTRTADFEWATKLNRFTLNALGIWPRAHKSAHDKFLSDLRTLIAVFVIAFVGVIPMIHALLRTRGDIMSTIDNLQCTLPLLTSLMKLVIFWWKKPDLIFVINMIAEDWRKIKTDKELRVMIKRAKYARVLTMIGYGFMILAFIFIMILPFFGVTVRYITNITDPGKLLPLQTHYFYDKERSPNYELTFVAQIAMSFMTVTSYTGVDTLFGLLIFHLCGQLENLKERLINIDKFKSFNGNLASIVKDHIRLIKCFNIIESTYSILLLGLLLYFSTLFCFYGFLIIAIFTQGREMSFLRFIFLASVMVNITSHMCLFCVVGEILVSQCANIHYATYDYKWYKLRPEEAKTLILIMIRASKPLYITAGKMFPMTMSMFCNLIKTSAGYVSILVTMQGSNN